MTVPPPRPGGSFLPSLDGRPAPSAGTRRWACQVKRCLPLPTPTHCPSRARQWSTCASAPTSTRLTTCSAARDRHNRPPAVTRRPSAGPGAEPLLGAPGLVPLDLGEPQLGGETQRAGVGGLGLEHHRLAGKRVAEPAECRRARLGSVPEPPCPRQEQVTELGPACRVSRCPLEDDLADRGPV